MNQSVTTNERAVLRAILRNYYTSLNGGVPQSFDDIDFSVWVNAINDSNEPSGVEGRALSGVVASLTRKALVLTDGQTISLTRAGYDIAA